ncbi:MAG: hypothetical protein FJ404_15485 [Verrucomicrobia bacterium]|nr:hypothetical protein [Verrucomicrobiota bacterium]
MKLRLARVRAAFWMGALAGAMLPLCAQPVPKLDSSSRVWLQRGTTNDLLLNGESLSGIRDAIVSGRGVAAQRVTNVVAATLLEGSAGGLTTGPLDAGKSLSVRIRVDAQAPLGSRELRVAGSQGVSNPLTIQISDLREMVEPKAGGSDEDAPWIELPVSMAGTISANAETDTFRFKARPGTKLIFDVQANRTGSPLDATLLVLDTSGKELAKSEDSHGLDPFLEFIPPEEGDYVLKLHDLRFQGGGDYRYRLVAGVVPYLDRIFPFGGRRGATVDLEMAGRNLEGSERVALNIASDAPLGRQDVRAQTRQGYSNPLPFEVGDLPEARETEPNDATDKANFLAVPGVANGRVGTTGDQDLYRFKSGSDQTLVCEVQARRFGSALDALLTLMDAKGGVLQRNDDADGPDARIQFDAKKDTEYLISIKDLTERGGPGFGYRLSIRNPDTRPDFAVRVVGARYRIYRGGSVPIRCEVDRRNGFEGLVRVSADKLPRGVSVTPLVLGAGAKFGWLLLTAASDAELGYRPLALAATSEQGGKMLARDPQPAEQAWLTVLDAAPFVLNAAPGALVIDQNAKASVEVSVVRQEGFQGEVKISAEELPGVKASGLTLPPNQSRGRLELEVKYDSETGTRPLVLRGEAAHEGSSVTNYAPLPVSITTHRIAMFLTAMLPGSPFFRTDAVKLSAVALPPGSGSQANSTEFVVKVDRRDMTNEIVLRLEGLPAGVEATVANLAAGSNEATIRLLVTEKAAAGKDHEFAVLGEVTHGDRIWKQKTQPITLKIEAPAKEEAAPAKATAAKSE